MMTGWTGRILVVDLNTGSWKAECPPEEIYHRFIGGKGLAGRYLSDRITLPWDSPDMPLLFFTGPLVGTASPASGRMIIMSRSPLTGTVCDASVGGALGTRLKRAGWDGIIITGRAKRWCGLSVEDETISLVPADTLSGQDTAETSGALGKGISSAVIGPAAENGVLFSSIVIDGHYLAGRGGLGLVMAAKRLKYLSIRGSGSVPVYNSRELEGAREDIFRLSSASPVLKGELGIAEFGTGALYDLMHSRRMMPTDNFRSTWFRHAPRMNAWHYREKYGTRRSGCTGCHILCKKKGSRGEIIPEFETMSHFSALLGNDDIETVIEANRLCNRFGMDTISAAGTLACFSEIEERNLSGEDIISLLSDIARSRGIGAVLKTGSYRFARSRGVHGSSMSVKKLELPAYDPRGAMGMALAYATSTRGGCHLRAYPVSHEILRKPVATDRFSFSGKARIIKISEDMNAVVDSLTACKFLFFAAGLEEYSRALYGATGVELSAQDLIAAGERIYYHERIMNTANGFSAEDDDLPERFFNEAGTGGDAIDIPPINRSDFLEARRNYYIIRGLDTDGMPTREKNVILGFQWKS